MVSGSQRALFPAVEEEEEEDEEEEEEEEEEWGCLQHHTQPDQSKSLPQAPLSANQAGDDTIISNPAQSPIPDLMTFGLKLAKATEATLRSPVELTALGVPLRPSQAHYSVQKDPSCERTLALIRYPH